MPLATPILLLSIPWACLPFNRDKTTWVFFLFTLLSQHWLYLVPAQPNISLLTLLKKNPFFSPLCSERLIWSFQYIPERELCLLLVLLPPLLLGSVSAQIKNSIASRGQPLSLTILTVSFCTPLSCWKAGRSMFHLVTGTTVRNTFQGPVSIITDGWSRCVCVKPPPGQLCECEKVAAVHQSPFPQSLDGSGNC